MATKKTTVKRDKQLTPSQIADIYLLKKSGKKNVDIENDMGLYAGAVVNIIRAVEKYWNTSEDKKYARKIYAQAVVLIKKRLEEPKATTHKVGFFQSIWRKIFGAPEDSSLF